MRLDDLLHGPRRVIRVPEAWWRRAQLFAAEALGANRTPQARALAVTSAVSFDNSRTVAICSKTAFISAWRLGSKVRQVVPGGPPVNMRLISVVGAFAISSAGELRLVALVDLTGIANPDGQLLPRQNRRVTRG